MIYEELPHYEEMKRRFKKSMYYGYYGIPYIFKEKKHTPFYRERYWHKGMKPNSHSWGRKPYWRKKRKEQRRG